MLLMVEGGGSFSSSSSGYNRGLSLCILGHKSEEKSMRVSPCNQNQLVDQGSETDLQLASKKNCLSHGCASFICFGRSSAGVDTSSILKVGPAQQQESLPVPLYLDKGHNHVTEVEDNGIGGKATLKSSMKKRPKSNPVPIEDKNESETVNDGVIIAGEHDGERRVQWTDACGKDLVEIREFESSERGGSDDELDNGNERSCSCSIM
ncbi:hypothetical protein SAY86_009945 [Trapa natans]|uniref:Uncharacterized protein n=1 Tax=Trapa natans TaxID=22666 RepID=A0AAN7QTE7_TRANT|nr:hypothetical protein SAY86_009945 [Trapa natans]